MPVRGLFFLAVFLLRLLPEPLALAIGKTLGLIWHDLIPIRKSLVKRQLSSALGKETSRRERARIRRGVFVNLGMNVVEFLRLDPRHPDDITGKIRREAFENYTRAHARGKGVLVLTAHFGNWDLLCCSQSLMGHPITILSKTIKPAWLNTFWMDSRKRCGIRILPATGVMDTLLEHLSCKETVGFVIDQYIPPRRGIPSEFFGIPAYTTSGLARLALESGAPVVPIFLYREKRGKHRMEVRPPVPLADGKDREECIRRTTDAYNRVLEEAVRKQPDQWLWLHRRWKKPACAAE